ncbi:MAG TPA: phosphate ABC transporter substrate-binding protein PstS [Ktedonobacteraceae bacterium]
MHTLFFSGRESKPYRSFGTLCLLAFSALFVACGASPTQSAGDIHGTSCPSTSQLQGAGSTFDAPLFSKMFNAYALVSCGIRVTYLGSGSAAGMNALLSQSADFAATDVPMTDAALARSQHGPILHIPITLGTEAIIYHVPGVSSQLKLTGPVLADIFLGTVAAWDDPAISHLNPGVSLPHLPITVVYRTDGSGTTGIFTRYLSQVSPAWKTKVGASVSVNWPVGVGFRGNGGVATGVQSIDGAIGYVELSYALNLQLPYAILLNAAGHYVVPSIKGAQEAAASTPDVPSDLRFFIVNAPGADAYPISGYSWVIVYRQQDDAEKGVALANLFWWMIHGGQSYASPLRYAPLSSMMVNSSEAQIRAMTCGSAHTPCYKG